MKKKHFLLIIVSFCFSISVLWAYPIFDLNSSSLNGLDQSESKNLSAKYVFQKNITSQDFSLINSSEEAHSYISRSSHLFKCFDPYYLKLVDNKGRTLWKTSTLYVNRDDNTWDRVGSPEINREYQVGATETLENALLLYDLQSNCYVLKKDNGEEIRYPSEISNYWIRQPWNEKGYVTLNNKFIFLQFGDGEYFASVPFEIAILGHNGDLQGICKTDLIIKNIQDMYLNSSQNCLLITYFDKSNSEGLLIISMDGKLIRNYPNFNPGNIIRFNSKAPDYAMLRLSEIKGRCILNTVSGEIVAGFDYDHLDMAQVDSTLIAITGNGPFVVVFDVLSGEIIQDFTDHSDPLSLRNTKILGVQISKDAKEIRYAVKKTDKAVQYLEYIMKE